MRTIVFVTSNEGKAKTLRSHLTQRGLKIAVERSSLELIEPQAATAAEVARIKAEQAFEQLGCPILVDDSSFHIYVLGGFPGPYIKYMLETVGADGIVSFMKEKQDRRAYATSTLVYVNEKGEFYEFSVREPDGRIASEVREGIGNQGWSDLWKIFIPDGTNKTLNEMTPEDHVKHRMKRKSAYERFAEWLEYEQ